MSFTVGPFEGVSDQQRLWLTEYLVDFNVTRAAKVLNIPYATVRNWLKFDPIKKAINYYLEQRRLENEELVKKTMTELLAIMTSDIKEFATWDENGVKLKASEGLKNTKVIKGIKETKNGVEIILHDKVRSIELMMTGLGMLKKPVGEDSKGKELPDGVGESLFEALSAAHAERKALPAQISMDAESAKDAQTEDLPKENG